MLQTASKWFARIVIVLSALLCLCFLPVSFFVGGMSVGVGPGVPFLSIVIVFFPVLVAGLLGIALFWLEYHPRYFPHGALAIAAAATLLILWVPRSAFIDLANYFAPPTPEQMRTLKWARRYEATAPAVVEFTINAAHFRVPREYLIQPNNLKGGPQYAVTFIAHVPDMRPLDHTDDNCVFNTGPYRSNSCGIFQFFIGSGSVRSADSRFAAAAPRFQNQKPLAGPFGFEEYHLDSTSAFFRKAVDGKTYFYSCQLEGADKNRAGICTADESAAAGGGLLFFTFDLNELGNIIQIDIALRHLVDSFAAN